MIIMFVFVNWDIIWLIRNYQPEENVGFLYILVIFMLVIGGLLVARVVNLRELRYSRDCISLSGAYHFLSAKSYFIDSCPSELQSNVDMVVGTAGTECYPDPLYGTPGSFYYIVDHKSHYGNTFNKTFHVFKKKEISTWVQESSFLLKQL